MDLLRAKLLIVHVSHFFLNKAGIISLLDEEEPQLKVGNCSCVGSKNLFIVSKHKIDF